MTNKTRLFKKSLLAVTITLASSQALAAGFQLNSQSATGLGRAFAGDAVIADNASVMSRNAAGMALFDSSQFSAGVNYIKTDINVSNITYNKPDAIGGDTDIADANNSSGTAVPNIYYIHRLDDTWAFGAGIYSNFGTTNNFDDSFGAGSGVLLPPPASSLPDASVLAGTTEIKSINYALTASYRVNEHVSLGAGLDIIQGSGKLVRPTGLGVNAVDIDADGIGLGWNVGAVYELDSANRFGLSYHYSPEIEAEGDIALNGSSAAADKVYLSLPSMAEFSGYHEIQDTKFAVHYSVQWIGWSTFDTLDVNTPAGRTDLSTYEWQDGWHYAIGGTYFLDDAWTLRAGYMYDTAAQDQTTSISVPDSDRQWFSAGFSYAVEQHTIDFGFTYLLGEDVSVTEDVTTGVSLTATTHADAILAGVQYSYSF